MKCFYFFYHNTYHKKDDKEKTLSSTGWALTDSNRRPSEAPFVGRDDTTRTCDPLVPNQVYYQLYYIPIFNSSQAFFSQKHCKGTTFI